MEDLSDVLRDKFISLQEEAKVLASEGALEESLALFYKAKAICPTKKVLSRIERLEEHIKINLVEEDEADEESDVVELQDGFQLNTVIYQKLYPYQRDGVKWMWKLHQNGKGGVLGDDMGLGKTFQVIAFLSGLIDKDLVKHILVVMPVSLIPNWKREFQKWCPGILVYEFHGTSKKDREQNLNRVQRRQGVLLTSYGMIVNNAETMIHLDGRDFVWDYVILDEGHKIKNPNKTTKAIHEVPAKHRLVLTGTPIQNNLGELWALYDFAHHGTLLGSRKTFKLQYEAPITRSLEKDASLGERRLGSQMSESLRKLIKPYFLRRTKTEVLEATKNKNEDDVNELGGELDNLKLTSLPQKNELILWVYLSDIQFSLYTDFLNSDAVKKILVATKSPLVELNILKKICDHPRLLSRRACHQLGLEGNIDDNELKKIMEDESTAASSIENVTDETLITESGKLDIVIKLLEELRKCGHRTLVFSLSRKILDMIQRILINKHWKVLRIDGTISKMQERDQRVQLFQNNSSYPVFLLTTQVGGVGITLTAADRVIIYDPSWNPAVDAQAVDRIFRIGQKKDVVVYRLITCGSVEEKIYRRQIFKDSITRQTTKSNSNDPHRYFSKQDLRELFVIEDIHYSNTQVQLEALHSKERKSYPALDEHIQYLKELNIFGISDHDLMFSKDIKDPVEDDDSSSLSVDYIKKRVEMAQASVESEAHVIAEGLRLTGSYVKPFTLPIQSSSSSSSKKTIPDHFQQRQLSDLHNFRDKISSFSGKMTSNFDKTNEVWMKKANLTPDYMGSSVAKELAFSNSVSPSEALVTQDDSDDNVFKVPQVPHDSKFGLEDKEQDTKQMDDVRPIPSSEEFILEDITNKNSLNPLANLKIEQTTSPDSKTVPPSFAIENNLNVKLVKSPRPSQDLESGEKVQETSPILSFDVGQNWEAAGRLRDPFGDLDFCTEEKSSFSRKSMRKSCVNRRTTIFLSDSEEDEKATSHGKNVSEEIFAADSDQETVQSDIDSIQESINETKEDLYLSSIKTPNTPKFSVSPLVPCDANKELNTSSLEQENGNNNAGGDYNSPECIVSTPKKNIPSISNRTSKLKTFTPLRLTPVKVHGSPITTCKSPFQIAIEKSVEVPGIGLVSPRFPVGIDSDTDSPIAQIRTFKPRKIITSDSEESEPEEAQLGDYREKNPSNAQYDSLDSSIVSLQGNRNTSEVNFNESKYESFQSSAKKSCNVSEEYTEEESTDINEQSENISGLSDFNDKNYSSEVSHDSFSSS